MKIIRYSLALALAGGAYGAADRAEAALRICNDTKDTQSVSVGYKDGADWMSKGWWNVDPGACSVVVGGELRQRYYYLRAEVKGGEFDGGGYTFCTTTTAYEIKGDSGCEERGYEGEDFREIDVGAGTRDFTYRLTQRDMDVAQDPNKFGLRFCNETSDTQSITIGYNGPNGFMSEGWWNAEPGACVRPVGGRLQNRYYYYRAEVKGGDFNGGGFFFCTDPKAFKIEGEDNCEGRGYDREDFAEIDVGEGSMGYTMTLTQANTGGPAARRGLDICNETSETQSVALGYETDEGWVSEGWWNVDPGDCKRPLVNLDKRYYYYRAEVRGGPFEGQGYSFCTDPKAFRIVGDGNCEARGYETEDFAEIDVQDFDHFVFTLVPTGAEGGTPRPKPPTPTPTPTPVTENGMRVCNESNDTQSVAIGYEGAEGWLSEGWWNVDPGECKKVLGGDLTLQYYYYRAEIRGADMPNPDDYSFCTDPKAFRIIGDTNCEARGYVTEKFNEVNVGAGTRGHTITLTAATPPRKGGGNEGGPRPGEVTPPPARGAGLEVCNESSDTQSLAFGYEGPDGWTSEGWWNVDPGACVVPALDGVNRRYLYYRAEVRGGPFEGESYFFCTDPKAFKILGDDNCEARGYAREDFREIDTGSTTESFTFTIAATGGSRPPGGGSRPPGGGGELDISTGGGLDLDRNDDDGNGRPGQGTPTPEVDTPPQQDDGGRKAPPGRSGGSRGN